MAPAPAANNKAPRSNHHSVQRWEVVALVAASIGLHTFLALELASARTADPPRRQQTVNIEIVPPPIQPPIVPPQAEAPPPPRPVRRPVRMAAAPPPPVPSEAPPPSEVAQEIEDPGPLPDGDENLPAAAASSGPPAPPAPPAPAAVVAPHEGANYLKNPRPPYPPVAMRQGWQGEVLVRVRVSPDGRAASVAVQRSSGRDTLDKAALEAVRGWLFVPARQGGAAVAGWVTVPIVFKLQ